LLSVTQGEGAGLNEVVWCVKIQQASSNVTAACIVKRHTDKSRLCYWSTDIRHLVCITWCLWTAPQSQLYRHNGFRELFRLSAVSCAKWVFRCAGGHA